MPGIPMIDPSVLHPEIRDLGGVAGNPAVMGAIYAAEHPDPNQWAKDAITALNNAEQLLQQLTSAISGNTDALAALDGHTYGYELTAAGTSGDTLAAAFISTKVQSITGGVTENSMTAARRPQEIGKKVWG